MKRLCIMLMAASLRLPLAAQTHTADSLRTLLQAQPRPDTTRVRRLQALSKELMLMDLPQAIAVLEQGLALSRRLADVRGEGAALLRLGTLYRRGSDYAQARRYTFQAQRFFARRADRAGQATAYLQLSLIENAQSNLTAALRAALQGLPYAQQAHDRLAESRLQMAVGSNYVQLGNYKDALPVLRATLKNAEALHDEHLQASVLTLLGSSYQMQENWPMALTNYRAAAQLSRRLGDISSAVNDDVSIAELYVQQGNLRLAKQYGQQALAAARNSHDAFTLPSAELVLARTYLQTGHLDSALALAGHGFSLSQSTRSKENLRNASDILAQVYARRGRYADAYRYQGLWAAYRDSIMGEETQRNTSALRYGYELGRKQDQIALLTQARQLQIQKTARQRQELHGLLAGLAGLVLLAGLLARNVFLKQRANRALNEKNDQIALQRDHLDTALTKLKATQNQLVQSEKMVALAALTAGVAHEMQNPLNFVNNFSEVSMELVAELEDEQRQPTRDAALEADLLGDLKQNLRRISQHGSRASNIVKGMLEHGHANSGQRQAVDLNALAQEYLRLAYHSLQSKHPAFTVAFSFDLDPALGELPLGAQEIGRVLLNLFNNALYAVRLKATALGPAYRPAVRVSTHCLADCVELCVRDNGPGIPAAVVDKIFDPFFTTKPPGDGTGLGLWLSYDIITKGYGGQLVVRTQEDEFTEFVVTLPYAPSATAQANEQKEVAQN